MIDARQRKYVPHLPSMLAVCEVNYANFLNLLEDCDTRDLRYRFQVKEGMQYQITILESARYTSTLEMTQVTTNTPEYLTPVVQVRLYHDARMAEVISSQRVGAIKASYAYPNNKMHQKNEKAQVNLFLAEWLAFCLKHKDTATIDDSRVDPKH